jgi:two-component system KDP operon response regulator KdpE
MNKAQPSTLHSDKPTDENARGLTPAAQPREKGPRPRILVVDDERRVTEPLRIVLEHAGYQTRIANSGHAALERTREEQPDLVILDVGLPDLDGFAVLERLREKSDVPVIMLTARTQSPNRIKSLDLGADDFIPKPFINDELLAHIRARLRKGSPPGALSKKWVVDRHLTIDFAAHRVIVDGEAVALTPTQWKIFQRLVDARGDVVPVAELLRAGWKDPVRDKEALKVQISQIRKKLQDPPGQSRYIHTHRNLGYSFAPPSARG